MADSGNWEAVQKKTFTRWCNTYLVERMLKINNIDTDLADGVLLCNLCEIISGGKKCGRFNPKPTVHQQKLENLTYALKFLEGEGLKLVSIDAASINQGRVKLILGLIWTIILRYQINVNPGAASPKQELLDWVRSKIPEYNINNFTKDWQSGKAIVALAEAVLPGQFNLPADFSSDAYKNVENAMTKAEENMAIPRILDPEDMVDTPDELSNMTYISYFRDYLKMKAKKDEQARLERLPVAIKCTASGPGLEPGNETGNETHFTIEAINTFGRRVPCGGHKFPVSIKGPTKDVPSKTVDNGDGTYKVTYTPTEDGLHTIGVTFEGDHIKNSPFKVNIAAGKPDPTKCKCYGPGLEGGEAHKPAVFTIEARNKKGDKLTSGGHPFVVNVTDPYGEPLKADVHDKKDGTYTVTYNPTDPGNHKVEVTLLHQQVDKSPYTVPIGENQSLASPAKSYAKGPGLEPGLKNTAPATFKIYAVDPSGKPRTSGGDNFDVFIEDPNKQLIQPDIKDNRDGTYTVTYQPTLPGSYNVDVVLRNPEKPLFYEHVKNSPVAVNIGAGADPTQCVAYGPGLGPNVTTAEPAVFTIEARDCTGAPIKAPLDEPFEVKIDGPNGPVAAKVVNNPDGTATVTYAPNVPGKHVVNVNLRDTPIKDAPFHIDVKPAGSPPHSTIEDYEFTVKVRDKRGNPIKEGGEDVKVVIEGPGGKQNANVKDNRDGTYHVSFNITAKGSHQISVLLKGEHVKGSPVTHEIS